MMSRRNQLARLSPKPMRILPPPNGLFRIRLAGALQPREEGFIGIDAVNSDSVDYVIDLKTIPWPIDDIVVDTIFAGHYFQRLDGTERIAFMNEAWRVLKLGAQLILAVPHWSSMRSISDPTFKFPPVCEASFVFFNKEWPINSTQ